MAYMECLGIYRQITSRIIQMNLHALLGRIMVEKDPPKGHTIHFHVQLMPDCPRSVRGDR